MNPKLIAIVAGSRDAIDKKRVFCALDAVAPDLLLHGGLGRVSHLVRRGTDMIAVEWAQLHGVSVMGCPPLWEVQGKVAGSNRNKLMLWVGECLKRASGARLVVVSLTNSRVPESLSNMARAAGVEVIDIEYDGTIQKKHRLRSGGAPSR